MPRPKGLPKTGGRKKSVGNRADKQVVDALREQSREYFLPNPVNPGGVSDFQYDLMQVSPSERVSAQLKALEYHTPRMKSVDMDATVATHTTIEDTLLSLAEEDGSV